MSERTYDGFIKREMSMAAVPNVKGISAGIVKVMAQGDGVVFVDYNDHSLSLQHRDHDYRGSTHLTFDENEKTWEVMGKPYFSRDDHKDVTTAATHVLTQALYQIVKAFAERYPDDMTNATKQRIQNDIDRLSKKREALRQEIGDVDAEIEKLNARL